jgi:hypothetical protein
MPTAKSNKGTFYDFPISISGAMPLVKYLKQLSIGVNNLIA